MIIFSVKPVFLHFEKLKTAKLSTNVSVIVDVYAFPDLMKPIQWINVTSNTLLSNSSDLYITSERHTLFTHIYGSNVSINTYGYRLTLQILHFSAKQEGYYNITVSNPLGNNSNSVRLILSGRNTIKISI